MSLNNAKSFFLFSLSFLSLLFLSPFPRFPPSLTYGRHLHTHTALQRLRLLSDDRSGPRCSKARKQRTTLHPLSDSAASRSANIINRQRKQRTMLHPLPDSAASRSANIINRQRKQRTTLHPLPDSAASRSANIINRQRKQRTMLHPLPDSAASRSANIINWQRKFVIEKLRVFFITVYNCYVFLLFANDFVTVECLLSSGRSWIGNSGMSAVKWEELDR